MGLPRLYECWRLGSAWMLSISIIILFSSYGALNYFVLTEFLGFFYAKSLKLASLSVWRLLLGLYL